MSQQDGLPVTSSSQQVTVDTTVTVQDKTSSSSNFWWGEPPTHVNKLPSTTLSVPSNGLVAIPVDVPGDAYKVSVTVSI